MTDQPSLTPEAACERLNWLLERGRTGQARELLGRALAEHPAHPQLLYYRARIEHEDEDNDEALAAVDELLAVNPSDYPARRLRYDILDDLKRFAEAELVIIDILHDYPEDADSLAVYALLMLKTGHVDKAERLAGEAIRLAPESEGPLIVATLAELVSHPENAAEGRLAELVRHHPEAASTATALVVALNDRGRYGAALEISRQLLAAEPHSRSQLELVIELEVLNHPTMWPLRPLMRFGWTGSAVMWFVFVGVVLAAPGLFGEEVTGGLILAIIAYVVYSWVWPPLLKRYKRRGL